MVALHKAYYLYTLTRKQNNKRDLINAEKADFYFCGASVDTDKLNGIEVDEERTTDNSVYLSGFLSAKYGNTKIYKAKKRLELRLSPRAWIDDNLTIKIGTSFVHSFVDLREENINEKYLENEIKKIQKIKVDFIV